jgi:gliding motility-associated-like protein
MKKHIIITLLLAVFSYHAVAQTAAPEIARIMVDEVGSVTLFWVPNTTEADFDHSEVWYQQSYVPGSFKIPGSETTVHTTSYYKHSGAQANNRQTTYHVRNYNSAQAVFYSETVNAIYLTACFASEKIQLTWNQIHSSWMEDYHIYRKAGLYSTWEFVDSTPNTSYQDVPEPGYENYSYKVYYKSASSPTHSVSNTTNPLSYSNRQPATPSITSIAVQTDGVTAIEWEKSPSTNVIEYIVYLKKNPDGWEELGRTSPDVFTWLDKNNTFDACEELRTYAIAAVDNCGETGTHYPDSSKNTFTLLYTPEYNRCNNEVILHWNPYESMTVSRYEIYVSDDNGNHFVKYAELPATATEYSYSDFQTEHYCFKVSAVHNRGLGKKPQTITTCQYCTEVHLMQKPGPCFFRYVSVNDNEIQISFEVDTAAISPKYRIERSDTGLGGFYNIVATIEPTDEPVIYFIDADPALKTQNYSYHYLLYTLDSCGTAFPAEKPAQSIFLTAKEDENRYAMLEWNDYDGFLYGLDHYLIHRYVNGELDNTFSVPINSNSFTDINLHLSDMTLSFAYRITAIGNPYTDDPSDRDMAFSNIAPLKRFQSDVWFPNAFTPTGSNPIFRPVFSGIEIDTYVFTIFDRHGAAIYQTTEPGGGWDGRINGSVAAAGGYGYMLKIKLKNGDRVERRGSMLLVR